MKTTNLALSFFALNVISLSAGTPHPVSWQSIVSVIELPNPYGKTTVEITTSPLNNDLSRIVTSFKLKTQKGIFEIPSSDLAKIKNPLFPTMFSMPFEGVRFSFTCDKNQPEDFLNKAAIIFSKGKLSIEISDNDNIPY